VSTNTALVLVVATLAVTVVAVTAFVARSVVEIMRIRRGQEAVASRRA
jgi:hypothetical protein